MIEDKNMENLIQKLDDENDEVVYLILLIIGNISYEGQNFIDVY